MNPVNTIKLITGLLVLQCFAACGNTSKWETTRSENIPADYSGLSDYEKAVQIYRDSMNNAFLSGSNKVIPQAKLPGAKPLEFFEISPDYRLNASFERIPGGEVFEMKTSTERLPEYKRFGFLHFKLGSDSFSLCLYQNVAHPDYLFCPFKDLTNGQETYGAGRYLDFSMADTLNPIIDFNYSYNPYCVYNHDYSCPIPPDENHLNVRIEAGIKTWH